jgi:hypothetical protein
MDWSAGPAALGGIMMCVALGGWSLGRWQALPATADEPRGDPGERAEADVPAPALAEACRHTARAERRLVLGTADRLGELHAEISAYRRAEAVLTEFDGGVVLLRATHERLDLDRRFRGIVDGPSGDMACDQAAAAPASASLPPLRPVQPSAAGEGTRV